MGGETWKKNQKQNISDDHEEQSQSVTGPVENRFRLARSLTSSVCARQRFSCEKSNKKHLNEAGKFVDFWIPMMSLFSSDDMLFKPKKYADVKVLQSTCWARTEFRKIECV